MIDTKQERLAKLINIDADKISLILLNWHNHPSKAIAVGIIHLEIEEQRSKIEHCKPEELAELQGRIKGLRIAASSLNFGKKE